MTRVFCRILALAGILALAAPALAQEITGGSSSGGGGGAPTGAAGGKLSGTYPNPDLAASCSDLSNGATGCSATVGTSATVDTGTSGTKIPLLDGANTWSGAQSINSGDLKLKGASSGTVTVNAAAAAGSNTVTLPAGTTDFSATGGSNQVVKQLSVGGALAVGTLACTSLSDGATGCSTVVGTMATQSASGVAITGGTLAGLTGLGIRDTSAAFDLTTAAVSSTALTAGRTLTFDVVNGSRTVKLASGLTIASDPGTVSGALKANGSGTFAQAACTDLSNGATGCSTVVGTAATVNTGTSGATIPLLNAANAWSAPQRVKGGSLTISTATFTPDLNTQQDFEILLVHASCPCTIANPSNISAAAADHQHGVVRITQSSTGSDTVGTWGSQWISAGGTSTLSLSSGANAQDYFAYDVVDSTHILIAPVALNASH